MHKSDVFTTFRDYKAWAENVTGCKIGILRKDKGGEFSSRIWDEFLHKHGIHCEHLIRDMPQQLGVTEHFNRTLAEGVMTALLQAGLTCTWWEDAANHFIYGKIHLPSHAIDSKTSHKLFYQKQGMVECLYPFGCLAYIHLQKDQHSALLLHAAQCIFIGYLKDYRGWHFWDPQAQWEVITDSAVFHKCVFPFKKPGLSGKDRFVDPLPPISDVVPCPAIPSIKFPLPDEPLSTEALPVPTPQLPPVPIPHVPVPTLPPNLPQLVIQLDPVGPARPHPNPLNDLPEQPQTPLEVRGLTSHFKHHLLADPLPVKCPSCAQVPGALTEDANHVDIADSVAVPLFDMMDFAFNTVAALEPKMLAEALRWPDTDRWIEAALAEIEAHTWNGTWELVQLPPGKQAIGSQWVFKVKKTPEGLVEKYKGRMVAQGFSQIPGIHYTEIFASTAHMVAMQTVMAIAAAEDMELESVDVLTAFLNGEIDTKLYMRILEGLKVEGGPGPGEDPK